MKVFILKEGKEYNQGVAYLDDGTMVVVDNARKMISKTIDVVVTSVLQTTAGKMIFGRFIDPNLAAAQAAAQSGDRDEQGAPPRRPRPVPVPPAGTVAAGGPPPRSRMAPQPRWSRPRRLRRQQLPRPEAWCRRRGPEAASRCGFPRSTGGAPSSS